MQKQFKLQYFVYYEILTRMCMLFSKFDIKSTGVTAKKCWAKLMAFG